MNIAPVTYRRFAPSPRLAPYVRFYRVVSGVAEMGVVGRAPCFPDGNVELLLNFGDPVERTLNHAPAWEPVSQRQLLAGPCQRTLALQCRGRMAAVNVSFRPGGALPFMRVPLFELTERTLSLDDLWPPAEARQLDALADLPGERLAVAADALLERRLDAALDAALDAPPPALRRGLDVIATARGAMSARGLAAHLEVAERTLDRQFREWVGLSPKRYARIVRFRHALRLLQAGAAATTDVALAAGYYDQAHLTNQFVSITGLPPAELLRAWRRGGLFQDT